MRNKIWFLLLFLIVTKTLAQIPARDSLQAILSKTTVDTTKVNLIIQLSRFEPSFKKRIDYANKSLSLAQKINYKTGQANAMEQLGGQYRVYGDYSTALHYAFSSLRIREETNDTAGMSRGYFIIGLVYDKMGDMQNALSYLQRAIKHNSPENIHMAATAHAAAGNIYYNLNKLDSALHYYQISYELFNVDTVKLAYCKTLTGLGDLQLKKGKNELAIGYYREAEKNCIIYSDTTGFSTTYDKMAKFYHVIGNRDSTIKYSQLTLKYATPLKNYAQINTSATLLSKMYQNEDPKISLLYLQTAKAATDSLFSLQKSGQLQSLLLGEKEKENADIEQKYINAALNKKTIQFALIAFGIICFIITFLILSRSFITNTRVIRLLSGIAMLMVFEFLNLVLHTFLGRLTHHSPLYMLLALVCIATLLVPLHHKLDQWATTKLVENNKAVRLAAAKRTIERLDEKLGNI